MSCLPGDNDSDNENEEDTNLDENVVEVVLMYRFLLLLVLCLIETEIPAPWLRICGHWWVRQTRKKFWQVYQSLRSKGIANSLHSSSFWCHRGVSIISSTFPLTQSTWKNILCFSSIVATEHSSWNPIVAFLANSVVDQWAVSRLSPNEKYCRAHRAVYRHSLVLWTKPSRLCTKSQHCQWILGSCWQYSHPNYVPPCSL